MKRVLLIISLVLVVFMSACGGRVVKIEAEQLMEEFEADRSAASEEYEGKKVQLSGMAISSMINKDGINEIYIAGSIYCVEDNEENESVDYANYQRVVIEGVFDEQEEYSSLIKIRNCTVTSVVTEPKVEVTLDELLEYDDYEELIQQVIEVEFVVRSIVTFTKTVTMEHGDYPLGIPTSFFDSDQLTGIEEGDTVRMKAVLGNSPTIPWGFHLFGFEIEVVE